MSEREHHILALWFAVVATVSTSCAVYGLTRTEPLSAVPSGIAVFFCLMALLQMAMAIVKGIR